MVSTLFAMLFIMIKALCQIERTYTPAHQAPVLWQTACQARRFLHAWCLYMAEKRGININSFYKLLLRKSEQSTVIG